MPDKPNTQALITIAMDNDAYQYSAATELSRILVKLAGEIATDGVTYAALRDTNGNTVGHFQVQHSPKAHEPAPSDIQILSVLDISTGHLNPKTMEMLDSNRKDVWPVIGGHIAYGYFMYAQDDDDEDIPRDLWACIEFARANGCSHLRFDSDGPTYADLKSYEHP